MRRELVSTLVELAAEDERIVLLTGDLGFAALEPFAERFPERFLNAGVAEQNMVGMATGLAEAGFTPYAYSISTFASMRPYEFIRNGPILHGLPVRIIGIGEGVDYGHNGMTHYALEDVSLMRTQPALTFVVPAASGQVPDVLRAVQPLDGPVYIRVSKQTVTLPALDTGFRLGHAQRVLAGDQVALVALGSMCEPAVDAAALMAERGVEAGVTVVSSVTPAPLDDLAATLAGVPLVVAIEAAYVNGGLGSMIAELIAEQGLGCRLLRAGIRAQPLGISGERAYMHDRLGLSGERIASAALQALALRPR